MRSGRIVVGAAGVVLAVLAYRVQIHNLPFTTQARAASTVVAALAFLVAGLVAWSRRPGNHMGPLMIAASFALLGRQLRYSHDPLAFTVFFALGELGYVLVAHATLAYPSGIVSDRVERAFLKIAYATSLIFPIAILLVYDGTRRLRYFDPVPRESLLRVDGNADLADALQTAYAIAGYGILASVFIALIGRKLVRATPRARRLLAPLLLAGIVAALRAVLDGIVTFANPVPAGVYVNLFWWQVAGLIALPIALLVGLLRSRLARASVGDLVVRLERTPPHGLRDELARTLGETSHEVALWLPERQCFADATGTPVHVPVNDPVRAVTQLEHEGEPLAALIHDPVLLDEPKLIESVGAAARLALENARLQAEVRAQLANVEESRLRIVAAGDSERRRIERDLHDGAQQRLVALALELRTAQRRLSRSASPEVERVLNAAVGELQNALEELRELAHGVYPAVLTEDGLAAALEGLADRTPLRVTVKATPAERLPLPIEVAAYFVACEALANAFRHSGAKNIAVELEYASGRYFTLIYSTTGALQWERGHATLPEAATAYQRLLAAVLDGRLDPAQPLFREDLED